MRRAPSHYCSVKCEPSDGEPSDTVLALTNKHVATVDTTTHYDYEATNSLSVLVCGERRFDRALKDAQDALDTGLRVARRLGRELEAMKVKADEKTSEAIVDQEVNLTRQHKRNKTLRDFIVEVGGTWKELSNREFATVQWAPEVSVAIGDRPYTRDIATLAVNEEKLRNFRGNIVDLGNQYSVEELEAKFWPVGSTRQNRTIPDDLQLPIRAVLPRQLAIDPDTTDNHGEPLYVVAKYGNTTKLTLGNYSGMDGYICTDLGVESRECVVYNGRASSAFSAAEDFSAKGDSGSLIFTGSGDGLAMLHSGMPRGSHNHITFGTPLWWVIELLLEEYFYADFYGTTYILD